MEQAGAGGATRLLVYRLRRGKPAVLVGGTIQAREELAFAYVNGVRKRRLLVFAVDELRRVYWYHPAWKDPARAPVAVPLDASPGVHELPEAVAHDIRGIRLTLFGVFLDQPLTVHQVEALIRAQQKVGPLPLQNAQQQLIPLQVVRQDREGGR